MSKVSDKYKKSNFFYYIVSIENLESVFKYGILSKIFLHKQFLNLIYPSEFRDEEGMVISEDISNGHVQDIRDSKIVFNNYNLHYFAPLYFNARNPMLYNVIKKCGKNSICILAVSKEVLNLTNTYISNKNAATKDAIIDEAETMLDSDYLNYEEIFKKSWNHCSYNFKRERKALMCAEVLVFGLVFPNYIKAIYIDSQDIDGFKAQHHEIFENYDIPLFYEPKLFFEY